MAIITPSVGVDEIKGSVGNVTFQVNRGVQIMRSKPRTPKQKAVVPSYVKALHMQALAAWQGLTLAQQTDYNDYAALWTKTDKFGNERTLSGANWFESLNWLRIHDGKAIWTTPPTHAIAVPPGPFVVTLAAESVKVDFDTSYNESGHYLQFYLTFLTTRSTTSANNLLKLCSTQETGPWDVVDLTTAWEARFGADWSDWYADYPRNIVAMVRSYNSVSGLTSPGVFAVG